MESEEQEQLTHLEFEEPSNQDKARQICPNGCDRPSNVCLCSVLPNQPLFTSTKVLILHHPHERRHKLATVPIITKCLTNCHIIIGRRLRSGSSPLLDSLHKASISDPLQPHNAIFLFPGTESSPSVELDQWLSSNVDKVQKNNLVLIVFDGTWKHAKEMVSASSPFLSKFASQVCLNYDVKVDGENIYNSDLVLRKEPFSGCMSTIEAVARSLRILEPNGVSIEEVLISVLRTMVHFQACHLKPMRPRVKMLNKGKVKNSGVAVLVWGLLYRRRRSRFLNSSEKTEEEFNCRLRRSARKVMGFHPNFDDGGSTSNSLEF